MPRTPPLERPTLLALLPQRGELDELATSLFGAGSSQVELPPLADLVGTLVALAEGKRRKAILPLTSSTGELAFVRQGDDVLFSYYDGGPVPQIFVRDRKLALAGLIARCGRAAKSRAEERSEADHGMLAIAERALRVVLKPDRQSTPATVIKRGGALAAREGVGLSFGFSARITQGDTQTAELATRADVHALLFDGELWAFVHGKRLPLVRGPIYPAIARMINAARSVVEAWENQRPLHVKLKAGEFGIGVRLGKNGEAAITLNGVAGESVTLPALDVSSALLPILRITTELARSVVSTDRAQAKNLRLSALRDEARALRRLVRAHSAQKSFVNRDHELLRASHTTAPIRERESGPMRVASTSEPGKLRMSLRWRAEVEGLDAASTFLCGDRIVIATPRSQLAISRDSGELLWARPANAAATLMAGTTLVSVGVDGLVELCDLHDGEAYARARIAPRTQGPVVGICAGGRGAPPVAVLSEGKDRLVAIDTRTGEPRWRFRSRGRGDFKLTRAGRILLAVSGDNTLDAIDVVTGEVAWRWSDRARLMLSPTVTRDRALAVAGTPGSSDGALVCVDLFSGQLVFRRELARVPLASAVASEKLAIVASSAGDRAVLTAFDLSDGDEQWQCDDPGISEGAAPLIVDHHLVVNSPHGQVCGIDLATGIQSWQHRLADPLRDDVPRKLEPVLRGGALFVPSANVHVVRPADGALLSAPLADGIIPDFMRVDERGWLYLAEESGHLEAYAPAPNLRLIKM